MSTYKSIVKTTGLIGFVQIIQILFGMIRNKAIAIMVGSKGYGLWALYNSFLDITSKFSLMGLDKSGVKEIAKNTKDKNEIAKIIFTFRTSIFVVSLFTAGACIVFSKKISNSLFLSEDYYLGVILVSIVVLFNGISMGQKSILNGLRDLRGLAISQVIGAAVGSIVSIISVYIWGIQGIPLYIFLVGLTAFLSTGYFVRKLQIIKVIPTLFEYTSEIKTLLKIGFGFSIAGVIAAFMTYLGRVYLTEHFDLSAVGIYQASWVISNLYIGTVLGAMGVDLMPRLSKVIGDKVLANKLINEQMELGLLIAGLGVVGILIYSPVVLNLFYSSEFVLGKSIIQYQVLGVSLRVLGFPFSYVIMTKERSTIYIVVQSIFWFSDYLLLVFFSKYIGFDGLGINYFISYLLYFLITWRVTIRLIDFKFSSLLKKLIFRVYLFISLAFISKYLSYPMDYTVGSMILVFYAIWLFITLRKDMDIDLKHLFKDKIWKLWKN